jgi:hypothetical protein
MAYTCYKITNLLSGKVYIGYTKKSTTARMKEHVKVAMGKGGQRKCSLQYAIAKYGKDNFGIEPLSTFSSRDEAISAEKNYILEYDSYKCGYNETLGGDGGSKPKIPTATVISVLRHYVSGNALSEIAARHSIPKHVVFDITRLRISDAHDIPADLVDALYDAKKSSAKRKKATQA